MKVVALKVFLKKHIYILRAIIKSRIELYVALVSGLKLLSNFTKNTIFGVREVLDLPQEYYNRF